MQGISAVYFCNLMSFLELCSRLLFGYLETIRFFRSCFYLLDGSGVMSILELFSTRDTKISCVVHSMPHGLEVTTTVMGTTQLLALYQGSGTTPSKASQMVLPPTSVRFLYIHALLNTLQNI